MYLYIFENKVHDIVYTRFSSVAKEKLWLSLFDSTCNSMLVMYVDISLFS